MKLKLKINNEISGKVVEKEIIIRNEEHLKIQQANKHQVFKNKKKYNRKVKHKKASFDF